MAIVCILGRSLTALTVVRGAYNNGYSPLLFDCDSGIAFKTNLAEKVICNSKEDKILDCLKKLCAHKESYLIATDDKWIQFIIENRNTLEEIFTKILHDHNENLIICLNKQKFSLWCERNTIPIPRTYHSIDANIDYPVIVRPVYQFEMSPNVKKAIEIHSAVELNSWVERFRNEKIDFILTESLLKHELVHYSVALAKNEKKISSFLAKRIRPFPEQCSVSTYVELCSNSEVELLARQIVKKLDYFGMAEIEIIYSKTDGKYYVIEINPRPWTQYALAEKTNHHFLNFLVDISTYDYSKEIKSNKRWINFTDDLFLCFSSNVGYVLNKKLSFFSYSKSLITANCLSSFSWKDPYPTIYSLTSFFPKHFLG
jgi:D-aspartate ligase